MKSYSLLIFVRYFVMDVSAHVGEVFCYVFGCDRRHEYFVDLKMLQIFSVQGFSFFGYISETENYVFEDDVVEVLPQLVHLIGPECVIKCLLPPFFN